MNGSRSSNATFAVLLPNFATSALLPRRLRCTVSSAVHGVDTSRCLRREFTAAPSYLAAASKAPGYLLAIECQQRQLLDARPRGEREVVSLKILDAKEDLQRDNLALASQSAAISRLGPAVAG